MEDLPKSTGGDFAGRKPIGRLRKNQSRYRLTASTRTLPTVPARPAHCRSRPHACGVILLLSLASPRTGGPHACHYRTAGSDSCARRRGRVAARGARAARRADAADRPPPKGLSRIMRSRVAACAIVVLLIGTADAEQCPPGALGVSRTLVVDPNEHPRVGSMQYPETLPLNDHEVVLTFDDGPVPRYTNPVLETLASECVKATFFMVGQTPSAVSRRAAGASCCCTTFTPAPSSRCPKFSTSSKAAATRSFMWLRQPRTGRKPQPPRSNGLPAPRPSSLRVHRKCAHCADRLSGAYVRYTMSAFGGKVECAGRPAKSRWCKSITMKE